jgi:hypothetical protein
MVIVGRVLLAGLLWVLGTGKFYGNHRYKTDGPLFSCQDATKQAIVPDCYLGYIEFDDEGQPWNNQAADDLLRNIRNQPHRPGDAHTLVIVYVPGWHDNAGEGNPQRQKFAAELGVIRKVINNPKYRGSRYRLMHPKDQAIDDEAAAKKPETLERVIGIYVGWRGKAAWPTAFDYLTFWSRKAAAQRVGRGSITDFLLQLDQLYDERQKQNTALNGPVLGMTVVADSFGAAVVLSSVERQFEAALIDAREHHGETKGCDSDTNMTLRVFRGLGDLVVLVNPAIEASQYRILDQQVKSLYDQGYRFSDRQLPILLTVSAENDFARRLWFRVGQGLAVAGRATADEDEERSLNLAFGVYDLQVSHCLEGADLEQPTASRTCGLKPKVAPGCPESLSIADIEKKPRMFHPAADQLYLGGLPGQGNENPGACLYPVSPSFDLNNPFLVVRATKNVLDGHGGLFGDRFLSFLLRFTSEAETKGLALRKNAEPCAPQLPASTFEKGGAGD